MKLLGFCLFVACFCCGSMVRLSSNSTQHQKMKLKELFRQLDAIKGSLQNSEKLLRTPPNDIEDCCSLPALRCFQKNFHLEFNITVKSHRVFYKSLKNKNTEMGINFCDSPSGNTTCQDCHEHPKENAREFFNRLESLIQKAIDRLSVN